jgi:hypothetical protein
VERVGRDDGADRVAEHVDGDARALAQVRRHVASATIRPAVNAYAALPAATQNPTPPSYGVSDAVRSVPK